jgi:hypothetical protein
MRIRSLFVVIALTISAMIVPAASRAVNIVIPPLSNFELVGSTLKFDALVNDCILSQPTSSFYGSSISPSSTTSELQLPAFQEYGSGSTKATTTLVTAIAFPFENDCAPTKSLSNKYSLALPEDLTFKYIYDQFMQTFIITTARELPIPANGVPSSSDSPVLSGPTSKMPLEIANAKIAGDVLTFEADLPECAINEPATQFFSSLIDPKSGIAELDKPELAYIGQNPGSLKTLVVILTIPFYTECKSIKSSKTIFKVTLPKMKYFRYIFDLNHGKFVFENQTSSPAAAKPPVSIAFVANRNLEGGIGAGAELIEVKIGTDGIPIITSLAKQEGVNYQIKAIAKNGLIVTAYDHRTKNFNSRTYLVSSTKWTLLSTKTIFVKPAVISTDLKTLYGRRVKDAANSTVIFAQNLKTGSTPSYFDAAKHGGGFICGVVSDPTLKLGYFTHLTKNSTDIYQIDLSNGRMKKLGATTAGACIDATDKNGNFIAKSVNPTSLETETGNLILISKNNPKSYRQIKIQETFMHTGMHSLLPFGDYVLGWNSTNDLHLVGLEKNDGFNFDYLDPETLAGPKPLRFLQYMCNLPLTWQSDPARPSASKARF